MITVATEAQLNRLRILCENYSVPFNEDDYLPAFDLPAGWVCGWVGGKPGTLFVGVSPEGEASS